MHTVANAELSRTNGFRVISVSSPSVRNQDKTKTCSEDDSVQGNVQASGLAHSDRRRACIRWRGEAQVAEKQGCHGPMDSRPFRSVPPRCATKTRIRPVLKLIQSKEMYKVCVSCTLIGGLRAFAGVGRLKSLERRGFTDPWIPDHFSQFVLGAHPRQD